MSQTRKDAQAEAAVRSAVLTTFGSGAVAESVIERIDIWPGENHAGDPALFVAIFLKPEQPRMSGARLLDVTVAASKALREIDDDRFPYVSVQAPEDDSERAEDTRPAA